MTTLPLLWIHFISREGIRPTEIGAACCDFINQIKAAQKYALDANPNVANFCAPGIRFFSGEVGSPLGNSCLSVSNPFCLSRIG
jgi:hypothetical protein